MKITYLLLFIEVLFPSIIFAQVKAVYGIVYDTNGNVLTNTKVCEELTTNCTFRNSNGEFALVLTNGTDKTLGVIIEKYRRVISIPIDTLTNPVSVYIDLDELQKKRDDEKKN